MNGKKSTHTKDRASRRGASKHGAVTRACAGLGAFGLALVGTASMASPASAAPSPTTPEALFRAAAAAQAGDAHVKATGEMAEALEAAGRVNPSAGSATVGTMAIVNDPDSIVFDVHTDELGDSLQVPELAGAAMQVPVDDPDLVAFYGITDGPTNASDTAVVFIDANGDGAPDLATVTPDSMALDDGVVTPVVTLDDEEIDEEDVVSYAGWMRFDEGYVGMVDNSELGLSSARFVFGLMDTDGNVDFAPDDFTGANVPLVAPGAPSAVKAKAGNGSATVSWAAPSGTAGVPVTYKVTASPGGKTCTTTKTSCTVTGLTNGTAYTFTVRATDAAGTSVSAPTAKVTPGVVVKVNATKAGYGNVLAVDVNPDKGSASYAFRVQKKTSTGWSTVGNYTTQGTKETRNITLGAGTYRVYVPASGKYGAAYSPEVKLTAPTAKVSATTDSAKSKIKVNVNPDKGSGYWSFKLQKRNAKGTWTTMPTTYKTEGSAETRTIDAPKGTYRVVVSGKYGYAGATSNAVTLVK